MGISEGDYKFRIYTERELILEKQIGILSTSELGRYLDSYDKSRGKVKSFFENQIGFEKPLDVRIAGRTLLSRLKTGGSGC